MPYLLSLGGTDRAAVSHPALGHLQHFQQHHQLEALRQNLDEQFLLASSPSTITGVNGKLPDENKPRECMQKTILRIAYILNIHNKLFLITNAYRNFNKKVNLKMLVLYAVMKNNFLTIKEIERVNKWSFIYLSDTNWNIIRK